MSGQCKIHKVFLSEHSVLRSLQLSVILRILKCVSGELFDNNKKSAQIFVHVIPLFLLLVKYVHNVNCDFKRIMQCSTN